MDKKTNTEIPSPVETPEVVQTPQKEKSIKKSIRNTAIGTIVVLMLLIGGGVAYTWWMGRTTPAPAVVIEEPEASAPRIEPAPIAENSPVSASVQSLTSPALAGQNVLLTVKTRPDATCTIKVEYNKVPSNDSGLIARTADDFGVVTWSWTVDDTAPVGKWPVTVTCVLGDRSAVVVGDLVVTDQIEE